MGRLLTVWFWLGVALVVSSVAIAGDKAESVLRLVSLDKADQAREKCDKWGAASLTDDEALRDACAKAWWPLAEAQDSVVAWSQFRDTWKGTEWAQMAYVRESDAALRTVGARKPEEDLLTLAGKYSGTPAEPEFRRKAGDAAVRDAVTSEEAVNAALRYPDNPDLPSLVERFPDGFIQVQFAGREVSISTKPAVQIKSQPLVSWVGIRNDVTELWDTLAGRYLAGIGVSPAYLDARPKPAKGPVLPLCWFPGQPPGFGPGVQVKVGVGTAVRPAEWDAGCAPDAWPVFITLSGDRVVALSLRPGHRLDLFEPLAADARKDVRAWLPAPGGVPKLDEGAIYVQAGSVWIGRPVAGGMPWATTHAPSAKAQSLTGGLQGAGVTPDWTLVPEGDDVRVESARLDNMPLALRNWRLKAGDVRVLAPLTQQVLGLSSANAMPLGKVAPALGPDAGWIRNPDGTVQRLPPTGGSVAGIYRMEPNDIEAALAVAAGVGISRESVQVLDGWQSDLDGDKVPESFVRALIDGKGAIIAVDPIEGKSAASASNARVFVLSTDRVQSNRKAADTPFSFRKGDYVYLAWSGNQVTGATTRKLFMEVLRFDGSGYTSDGFDLP